MIYGNTSIANSIWPVTQTYAYDYNGNVKSDSYRGIAFVIYDINNLPVSVYTTNGQSQVYSYDVTGNRVRKYASNGTDTYYINNPAGQTELVQRVLHRIAITLITSWATTTSVK